MSRVILQWTEGTSIINTKKAKNDSYSAQSGFNMSGTRTLAFSGIGQKLILGNMLSEFDICRYIRLI